MAANGISTLTIASGTTLTKDVNPPHSNTEIVAPFSAIWSLNYVGALGATNDVSYKLYATLLGEGSALTLTSHQTGDFAVTAGNFLFDEYGNSIGIIKGNTTIDNYMAKAAALVTLDNTIVSAATYKGTWNAFSDTPTLADGVGTLGDAYDVTTSGTSGEYPEYVEQDWRIYDGATWIRVDKTDTTEWTITPATAGLADKEARQIAKLNLAANNRSASSNPRASYIITQLPTQYDGYNVVDNANSGGLVVGRPWTGIGTDDPANAAEPEATAWVLMDGPYGDGNGFYAGQSWRKMAPNGYAPYGKGTYIYGDEKVHYDGTWKYENTAGAGFLIATGGTEAEYPWQAAWTGNYKGTKITAAYVKTTNYPAVP
jgi:hypothetical protein